MSSNIQHNAAAKVNNSGAGQDTNRESVAESMKDPLGTKEIFQKAINVTQFVQKANRAKDRGSKKVENEAE